MNVPVFLFVDRIRYCGAGFPAESIRYYYYNKKFWTYKDIGDNMILIGTESGGVLLEAIGEFIYFDAFLKIYREMSKEYCLDEERVNYFIRECQLKNLLEN